MGEARNLTAAPARRPFSSPGLLPRAAKLAEPAGSHALHALQGRVEGVGVWVRERERERREREARERERGRQE